MKTSLLAICVVLSTTASALASSSPEEMYRGQVDTPTIVSDLWTAPAGSSDTVAVRRYAEVPLRVTPMLIARVPTTFPHPADWN